MKQMTVTATDDGRRLDRWLKTNVPSLPVGLMQKFLRLKKIRLNGKPAHADDRIHTGDTVRMFLEDEFFAPRRKPDALLSAFHPHVEVVYEDEHLLLVDKKPGLICHPDETEKVNTLLTHVRAYLYQKGEGTANGDFAPVLVNRIDRFTGGIVICAKTEASMRVLSAKIRAREIEKSYLCVLEGEMRPPEGLIDNYIFKEAGKSRVRVLDRPSADAQRAQTRYRTLARRDGLSLVECTLITGRTHQIRAQFSHAGHPLLGDLQYGARRDGERQYQALYAYRLCFDFLTDAGILNYLNGREFHTSNVPFVREYFPDFS